MAVIARVDALAERYAGGGEPDGIDARLRERLYALVCCLGLIVLTTSTRPGKILADTKIDMAVNPVGFLGRALHIWDVEQFGQLQNQVAGYLFPMGPFYVIGHVLGMPAWIVQRLWLAALLCTAFVGARQLAARLGIGTPATRLVGALAYAIGPHGLAALGTNSSDYMPLAMLPWIVLPLVTAAAAGSRIRAAARSGIAVAFCGGINGAATFAVLLVPVIYVLTRPRGTARVRTLAWWGGAVGLATAWWLVPLVLLGRYAFSWLTYTEKSDATTPTTGLANVFRGTERWVDFLVVNGHAWWPLGHALATETVPILFTGAAAALGLAGLVRRGLPERSFLLVTVLAGVAIVAAGHTSVIESPLAPSVRHLIDGPLAPVRNLYKFDGLVRLPLALGLAHLLGTFRLPRARLGVLAATAVALAGVAAPAMAGGLSARGDFPQVPQYWRDATAWLNARAGNQGVLVVPGSRFGEYLWGRPMDEINQPLLTTRWAQRQLVPAGSPGLTRMLDAIDQRVTSGRGSAGLTQVLARMGVRYLLVSNDLDRADLRGAWPGRVHMALDGSPGLRKVAGFGAVPAGGTWPDDAVNLVDQPYQPVEIYEVGNAGDVVGMADADQVLRLYGSPETLFTLADDGLLRGRPVLLDGDGAGTPATTVVSDGLRLVERNFGEIREQTSPTLTAADTPKGTARDRDIIDPGWERYSTAATYTGIKDVTASSSESDTNSIAQLEDPGSLPYAALDGNPWTRWQTGGWNGPIGQWLKVDFDAPRVPQGVSAAFAQDPALGPPPDEIAVETATGRVVQHLRHTDSAQPLQVPAGVTGWLRIRVLRLAHPAPVAGGARVAISELNIPGVRAARHYLLPTAPKGSGPETVIMSRAPGLRAACMQGSVRWVCDPALARQDEEGYGFDRIFSLPSAGSARMSGTATLTDPALVQRYAGALSRTTVAVSSTLVRDPADIARSAFDGDPATSWIAATGDRTPWFTVSWDHKIQVSQVTVHTPPGGPGPLQVRVEGADGAWRAGPLDSSGRLRFAPMRTDRLTLRFSDPDRFATAPLQVSDIMVPGVGALSAPGAGRFELPCGYGPQLTLNGKPIPTSISGTYADLLGGRPMRFQACSAVTPAGGENELRAVPLDSFRIDSAVVDPNSLNTVFYPHGYAPPPPGPPAGSATVSVTSWNSEHRTVQVDAARQSYLTVNENFNSGWQAHIGSTALRPVRLDGWRQAWVVPAGTVGTVRMDYGPDLPYRASVLVGLNLLLVLMIAAVWPVKGYKRRTLQGSESLGRFGFLAFLGSAVLGFWLAGYVGLGICVIACVVPLRRCSPWVVAGAMLAGAGSLAAGYSLQLAGEPSRGLSEVVPQILGLVIVGRLLAAFGARAGTPDVPPGSSSASPRPPSAPLSPETR